MLFDFFDLKRKIIGTGRAGKRSQFHLPGKENGFIHHAYAPIIPQPTKKTSKTPME